MFNRKSKKRIISLLAAMMMIFTMVPGTAFAETWTTYSVQAGGTNPNGKVMSIQLIDSSSVSTSNVKTDTDISDYWHNVIEGELDESNGLEFKFVPKGSGFNEKHLAGIQANAYPKVNIYKASTYAEITDANLVASQNNGMTFTETYNATQYAGYEVSVAVDGGKVADGNYALVFDATLYGNKADTALMKDIVFFFSTGTKSASGMEIYMDIDGDGTQEVVNDGEYELETGASYPMTVKVGDKKWAYIDTKTQIFNYEGGAAIDDAPVISMDGDVSTLAALSRGRVIGPKAKYGNTGTLTLKYGDAEASFKVTVKSPGYYDAVEKGGLAVYECDADGTNEVLVENTALTIEVGEKKFFKVKYADGTAIAAGDQVEYSNYAKPLKVENIKVGISSNMPCVDVKGMAVNAYNMYDAFLDPATGIIEMTGKTETVFDDNVSVQLYGESVATPGTKVGSSAFAKYLTVKVVPATKEAMEIYIDMDGDGTQEKVNGGEYELETGASYPMTVKVGDKKWAYIDTKTQIFNYEGGAEIEDAPVISMDGDISTLAALSRGRVLGPKAKYGNTGTLTLKYGDAEASFKVTVKSPGYYDAVEKGGLAVYECDADGTNEVLVENTALTIEVGEKKYFKVKYADGTAIAAGDQVEYSNYAKPLKVENIKVGISSNMPCVDVKGMAVNAYNMYDAFLDPATGIIEMTGKTETVFDDSVAVQLYGESVATPGTKVGSSAFSKNLTVKVVPATKPVNKVATVKYNNIDEVTAVLKQNDFNYTVTYSTILKEYSKNDITEMFTVTSSNQDVIADSDITVTDWKWAEGDETASFNVYVNKNNVKQTGKATITVVAKDDASITTAKTLNVIDGKLSNKNISKFPGYEEQLTYTLYGEGTDPAKTVWSSSDESVATVDETGLVKLVGNGTCEITVVNGDCSAKCTVNSWADGFYVDEKFVDVVKIDKTGERTAVTMGDETYYMDEHVQIVVRKGGIPVNAPYWQSANTGVARMLENGNYYATADKTDTTALGMLSINGKIEPVANGETVITVKDYGMEEVGQIRVIVTGCDNDAEGGKWEAEKEPVSSTIGGSIQLKKYAAIRDLTNAVGFNYYINETLETDVEFTLTITGSGKKGGSADYTEEELATLEKAKEPYLAAIKDFIVLKDKDGNEIDAEISVESVYLNGKNIAADVNVKATGLDNEAQYTLGVKALAPNINSVGANDYISYGKFWSDVNYTFNIVEAEDPTVPADSVTLDKSEATVTEGETVTLTATVAPENTTDKTVTWTSSDEAVATVDANGVVTAVAAGTATITATCGDAAATCVVTVNAVVVPEDPEQPEQPIQPEEPSDDPTEDPTVPADPEDDAVTDDDESDADTDVDEDADVDSDEEATENADKADKDDSAQTGDESNMGSMFALMMAALLTAGAVFVRRREN